MFSVNKVIIPINSEIVKTLNDSYYSDSYSYSSSKGSRVALQVWLEQATKVPSWVNFLMASRNQIVSILGLKNLGHLGDVEANKLVSEYQIGDRVGIFTLLYLSDHEIILGDSDKHLDVKLSVYIHEGEEDIISISTVVHVHNLLGKLYMLFVEPLHQLIVPASIKRAETSDI
ncbi:DUF2867 domain-containing protein [Psychromonas algicola]|uniref:DUF2867 domain-containing protein n=1 Tax=Psychromonas algicola TaxID=2555642 RepID=UPI001419CAC6|nr:DUF2867 domain-containing protein [Psychromonas sp. RZ5]